MKAKKFLHNIIFTLSDCSLIYTALLNTSVMYYYRDVLTPVWFLSSLIITALLFKIFDFISRHKITGPLIYIAIFIAGIYCAGNAVEKGKENYPIGFILWFITTQDALDYNPWYTLAVFIFFTIFFASVVYYFTKIRYRISIGFLIFIIPFVIYGKESSQMPALFIILLSLMFVVNMICFNNLKSDSGVITTEEKNIILSVFAYTSIFGVLASVLPKPNITADRTYLESLINMDAFTDMLISKINIFNNEASSGKFNSLNTNDKILYYANADEPLRLKTQVFTDYNFSSDTWTFDKEDYYFSSSYSQKNPSEIIKLIALCSELDNSFSKKYNINSSSMNIPNAEKKKLNLYSMGYRSELLPVPSWIIGLDTPETVQTEISNFGTVREKGKDFYGNNLSCIEYYSDSFIYNTDVCQILTSISYENLCDMYSDMYNILSENNMTNEAYIISDVLNEAYSASDNLDYGENQKILDLALEITDGLDSDYEKALAIEGYFFRNNYIYDLTYKKSDGENAEDFLFNTKRGVCYEYATAMVLLSRACGIPARYAEGYNMNQPYEDNSKSSSHTNYVIRIKDAHGFPELYIPGTGWTSFEPTVSDRIIDYTKADISKGLYISGIILAVFLIMGFLLFRFYPSINNAFFMAKIKRATPEKTVSLIFLRVRQLCGFGKDVTVRELCQALESEIKTDLSPMKNLLEKSSYGRLAPDEKDKKDVIKLYSDLYLNLKDSKKIKR